MLKPIGGEQEKEKTMKFALRRASDRLTEKIIELETLEELLKLLHEEDRPLIVEPVDSAYPTPADQKLISEDVRFRIQVYDDYIE